jgi:iron complex transport system substrate-binding protein
MLVGRSAECDHPAGVEGLPVVTAARIDSDALRSADIDAAVRAAVLDGRPLYALDEELIRRLAPDLVITQDLCHVCAVSSDEVGRVRSLDADVLALDPRTLAEVAESVRTVARRLDVPERGEEVAAVMERTIATAAEAVAGAAPVRVFVAEWLDPPFAAGHWLPEMVAAAGGIEVMGAAGRPSFPTTWDDVAAARPELVVAAACGFDAARIADEAAGMRFPCRTVAVDANAHYSRPAPRLAEGVAQLAFLLHPDLVDDPGLPWVELETAWTR